MSITFDDLEVEPSGEGGGSSRRRWAAGVGAAMLIAAAGGVGYGIGRSVDDSGGSLASPDVTAAEPAPSGTEAPATTDPLVDDVPARSAPLVGELSAADSSSGSYASGGVGYSSFGGQPMTLLAERVTDTGFVLRAHLGQIWDNGAEFGDGSWQPAPWCFESGQLRIALSGNGVIDVGGAPWYSEPYQGRAVSWLTLGTTDGQPQWVIVAQAPLDTTKVTVTFADGATDSAAPVNGIALLTAPGVAPTEIVEGDYSYWSDTPPVFTVAFEGGADPRVVSSDGVGTWNDPEFRAACEPPPPALPDPGEQPADAAAAEAEIVAAMTALYDSTVLLDGDAVYLDDSTGVSEARAQVAEGGYSTEASSATAVIEELVFTTPTEAWFRYRVDTDGVGLSNRYGIAVVVDGAWRITRDTVCQDLSMAGGDCGGGWVYIQPPSVFEGERNAAPPPIDVITTAPTPGD